MPAAARMILLEAKLQAPEPRRELVPRPELVERLVATPARRLTLLSAPPGWGKTTLLGEWSATDSRAFAWVQLDAGDNDPARFWTYVAEALNRADARVGAAARDELALRGADLHGHVLPLLANELAALDEALVLVLDDLHVVTNPEVHDQLAFLVDHLPTPLELVLATRIDPPLPLPRLRTRGQLLELRAQDLRFSSREAAALLNELLHLDLEAGDIDLLQERTEGWAAALYLAALSLRGRADARSFVEAFAGDDRHLVDYLGAEVLDAQPQSVRSFLLHTSVLERLSAPLCDAVTGSPGSGPMLEEIERANLFLVPLDRRREWYRYHHLFAELLRLELMRAEPDLAPELHRRASRWLREHEAVDPAIQHAVAAGDLTDACELVATNWVTRFNRGRLATVSRWLDALPEELVCDDARLALARAWIAADRGQVREATEWLSEAEARAVGGPIEAETAVLRAVERFKSGNVGSALDAAGRALALDPPDTPLGLDVARCIHGVALFWLGRVQEAEPELRAAVALAPGVDNELARAYALGYLALALATRGESSAAVAAATEALGTSEESAPWGHFVAMVAYVALARAQELEGTLEEGEASARRAVALARRGAGLVEVVLALTTLATILRRRGALDEARALAVEARAALAACEDPGVAAADLERVERATAVRVRHTHAGEELSERERAVLRLLGSRLSLREIGNELYVSLNTVKTHSRAIYRKLDASSREEAVARGRELGLL